jgi:hypothetical protein
MTKETEDNIINEANLNPEFVKAIDSLIIETIKLNTRKKMVDDQTASIAETLGIKKAALNRRVKTIMAEQEKGGVLIEKNQDTIFVENYLNMTTVTDPKEEAEKDKNDDTYAK